MIKAILFLLCFVEMSGGFREVGLQQLLANKLTVFGYGQIAE